MVQVQFEADQARTENDGGMAVMPVMVGGSDERGEMDPIETCITLNQSEGGPSTYGANHLKGSPLSIRPRSPSA